MSLDKKPTLQLLKEFDFPKLFIEELGWDRHSYELHAEGFTLRAAAEKRGLVAFVCEPGPDGRIPDYATRRKIEKQVAKSAHEHIIIFIDAAKSTQVWQWVRREAGRPAACREHTWHKGQSGEALFQRLDRLFISLDEEEDLTLPKVASRARAAFDVDKITKRFYDRFQKEHEAFLKFIKGIQDQADSEWYASLMLNRLMFVYFIQRKGFLDGDRDYLRNRLDRLRESKGKDRFQTFYRHFLLRLFHEGLGGQARNPELDALLGKVPFLNGGLFEVHELEEMNKDIQIPDEAFQKLFDFFDAYQWHLDERPLRADNEINPDVLGYIFEKYINQKQMGAYYTKEDITEYNGKNTIIPWLLSEAERHRPDALRPKGALWGLLRENPDRYLYAAVRHGVIGEAGNIVPESELPDFVQAGMRDPNARMSDKRYNLQQAPKDDPIRLVTETWREYIARRERCLDLCGRLAAGEIHAVNDLITWNLDIRQFAQDVIENCADPELLRIFWRALTEISVLDPTCGSGAFLFAALNILEVLYDACLDRMQAFLDEAGASGTGALSDFRDVLDRIAQHPNRRHFILKSIVISNLYGVDLMEEAVEICKLRLFLKLVAQVESVEQIEPLPDIDFNIRAGNALVGFASIQEVRRSITGHGQMTLDLGDDLQKIDTEAALVDADFKEFRREQTAYRMNAAVHREAKQKLRKGLHRLAAKLDIYLAGAYGVDSGKAKAFDKWRESHQPFHWFVEFYGIIHDGGFDVLIGNPPYIVYSPTKVPYTLLPTAYSSLDAKNLYAYVFERSLVLTHSRGMVGMIVQMTVLSSEKLPTFQNLLMNRGNLYALPFPRRPESIFDGVEMPVAIILSQSHSAPRLFTSRVGRFYTAERSCALSTSVLLAHNIRLGGHRIAKLHSPLELNILQKLGSQNPQLGTLARSHSPHFVYYQEACRYWPKAILGKPFFKRNGERIDPPHGRFLSLADAESSELAFCILNSSLFYWFYSVFSDCEHINDALLRGFCIPLNWRSTSWAALARGLATSLATNARRKTIKTNQGHTVEYDEINAALSKPDIDAADQILASSYGFTNEELDFIVNYDIKYRMGADTEEAEEP